MDQECRFAIRTFLPGLRGYGGHVYAYNKDVSEAVEIARGSMLIAVPEDLEVTAPSNWVFELATSNGSRGVVNKFKMARSIRKFLNTSTNKNESLEGIFLESFSIAHLLTILTVPNVLSRVHIFLLYRYGPQVLGLNKFIHKLLLTLVNLMCKGRLHLLTDSVLIKERLGSFLKKELFLLPIPHTQFPFVSDDNRGSELRCWWPGERRAEKGEDKIISIAKARSTVNDKLTLLLPDEVILKIGACDKKLVAVQGGVSRDEYAEIFSGVSVVLLPYMKEIYGESTSGVFVEAITLGKYPIVSEDTWMHRELKQYDLEELVFDFDRWDFWEQVLKITSSPSTREKLNRMSSQYQRFHNKNNFVSTLATYFHEKFDF